MRGEPIVPPFARGPRHAANGNVDRTSSPTSQRMYGDPRMEVSGSAALVAVERSWRSGDGSSRTDPLPRADADDTCPRRGSSARSRFAGPATCACARRSSRSRTPRATPTRGPARSTSRRATEAASTPRRFASSPVPGVRPDEASRRPSAHPSPRQPGCRVTADRQRGACRGASEADGAGAATVTRIGRLWPARTRKRPRKAAAVVRRARRPAPIRFAMPRRAPRVRALPAVTRGPGHRSRPRHRRKRSPRSHR
jgi:hypothetical protein